MSQVLHLWQQECALLLLKSKPCFSSLLRTSSRFLMCSCGDLPEMSTSSRYTHTQEAGPAVLTPWSVERWLVPRQLQMATSGTDTDPCVCSLSRMVVTPWPGVAGGRHVTDITWRRPCLRQGRRTSPQFVVGDKPPPSWHCTFTVVPLPLGFLLQCRSSASMWKAAVGRKSLHHRSGYK